MTWPDATEVARAIRAGEVSPVEAAEEAARRIEALNPTIGAVVTPMLDEGVARAGAVDIPDGPFRGVPFLYKDIGGVEAGMPLHLGNAALRARDARAAADTVVGARFRAAGFVTLGKSATPEFGAQPTTQPIAYGPVRNPWDTTRSTSGSSGGSAAAVASGMVPIAHANDGYGSIRDPASWCGLVGLKATRGRVSSLPSMSRYGAELVVSRSVRDTAAVLAAMAGPAPGELYGYGIGVDPAATVGTRPLRVAVIDDLAAAGLDVHPESVTAARVGAQLLAELGHDIVDVDLGDLVDEAWITDTTLIRSCALRTAVMDPVVGYGFGYDDCEPYTAAVMRSAEGITADALLSAQTRQHRWAVRVAGWWSRIDLLVTPATGEPPASLVELEPPVDEPLAVARRFWRIRGFAAPFNVSGHPAISLPLHWTDEGMPSGVQIVADTGREDLLLALAAQLEQMTPWSHRVPPASIAHL